MGVADGQDGLEELLLSFEETGQLDSRGVFTLAGRRAAGKLARSLLPEPADWILKVVQSACRAKASELRISQRGKATHVAFSLPFQLDLRAFELSLTQAQAASQPGVEELATALRVLGLAQDRSWVARVTQGKAVHWILANQGEVSVEVAERLDSEATTSDLLLGIAYPPGQAGKLGGLVRFGAAIQNEHEALLTRTRACPIPLFLDGSRLDDMARTDGLASIENEAFLTVALGHASSELPCVSWPSGLSISQNSKFQDRFWDPRPYFLPDLARGATGSSLLRVAFRFQKEPRTSRTNGTRFRSLVTASRIVLIRHGVVVGQRNLGLSAPIAIDVYLNADDLAGNLSGLEVEVLPLHADQARREIEALGPCLRELGRALSGHRGRPSKTDWVLGAGLGLGAAALLVPWPIKLLGLGMTAIHLRTASQQYRGLVAECASELTKFSVRYCEVSPRSA